MTAATAFRTAATSKGAAFRLERRSDPEPDLAVVPGRPRDYAGHPTTANLVVEVADSSLDFDTKEKRPLYARAAADNAGSLRVLQKCGFRVTARAQGFANARGEEIDEFVLTLDA